MPRIPHPIPLQEPLVVKLGGSLYSRVSDLIPVFRTSPRPLLIVPGGGRFADDIRRASLSDEESHWQAIGAMDTFGKYVSSFGLDTTLLLQVPKKTVILLPLQCMRAYDPLPHSWDVTSDSIAAWIAGHLSLDLLILKSVDGIPVGGVVADTLTIPVETDIVDPCCLPAILDSRIIATVVNGSHPDRVRQFLLGHMVPGTRIGTTF